MKRIVIFFPSWRYFGHFALPLFEPLAHKYKIIFMHTEKAVYGWDDCPDLSDRNIETIDLKSLKTVSFVSALKKLNADAVVVFDKGWVQDRALLHAARYLNIPSFHIQHGIIAPLEKVETKNRLQRVCNESLKILRTFLVYDATLLSISIMLFLKSLRFQCHLLRNPNDYYFNHRHEIVADLAGIIGERDLSFFVEKEGYQQEQLIPLGALQFKKAYTMESQEPVQRLLLISQPLFEDHLLEGGLPAKEKHIREIIEASPLPVAIKPHPREDREWYATHFESAELFLYSADTDICEAILECSHVIGYFSTALISAVILKRPVGIIRWVVDQAYVLSLDKEGAAFSMEDPQLMKTFVAEEYTPVDASLYAYEVDTFSVLQKVLHRLLEG